MYARVCKWQLNIKSPEACQFHLDDKPLEGVQSYLYLGYIIAK